MPLIIITGHPSSGKTYRARQLLQEFEARIAANTEKTVPIKNTKQRAVLIPSHHASLDSSASGESKYVPPAQSTNPRDLIYNLASAEKTARAEEFSAIKRALNKNDVVIADGLNYIKGFRYQLWCEAKAAGTRCIVVHVAAREDECEQWNHDRLKVWGWECQEDAEDGTGDGRQMKVGGVNVMVGRNVMGELEPESHTALYGDRVVDYSGINTNGIRSRSSSMGAAVSDDGVGEGSVDKYEKMRSGERPAADAMTLKSLYISDQTLGDNSPNTISTNGQDLKLQSRPQTQALEPTMTNSATISMPPSANSSLGYSPSTLKSLLMRYEPPSPFTRWDTPLFTVPSSDSHPPYEQIWNAIFPEPAKPASKKAFSQLHSSTTSTCQTSTTATTTKTSSETNTIKSSTAPTTASTAGTEIKPHQATLLPKATSSEALQILESATAETAKLILQAARDQNLIDGEGGHLDLSIPVVVSSFSTTTSEEEQNNPIPKTLTLPLNTPLSQPMLQRLRRKYTQLQRGSIAHGQGYASASGRMGVVDAFLTFLQAEFDS